MKMTFVNQEVNFAEEAVNLVLKRIQETGNFKLGKSAKKSVNDIPMRTPQVNVVTATKHMTL